MKKPKTVFIAPVRNQAEFWARAWGFTPDEWFWIGREVHARGRDLRGQLAFFCGSQPPDRAMWRAIVATGVEGFIEAHDLDTSYEPHSSLDLLPVKGIES